MQPGNYVDFLVLDFKWILEKSLWTLTLPASALVLWRLYSLGLHKTYRAFFGYLSIALIRTAILLPFSPRSKTYYDIWAATQPLMWLFYILVVTELYSLVLKKYPGIYSLSRWFFFCSVAAAVIISALTVLPNVEGTPKMGTLLYNYALIARGILTSLAIFLLLLLALAAGFSVPLSRNLLTHCSIYSAYFFANNIAFLYWHVGGKNTVYVSTIFILGIELTCLFCWVYLLSQNGEDRTTAFHLGRSESDQQLLLGKLASFNATLLRTARK